MILFILGVSGTNSTFINPIGDAVRHVRLLIGGGEAQRLTAGARLVVDISIKHEGLARAADTEGANPLSESAGCSLDRAPEPQREQINHPPADEHKRDLF